MNTNDEKIQWHPAFDAALQIELGEETKYLEFDSEHLLSKKPMQIDVLVKNERHVKIQKNIGRIFRQYNIVEYKSGQAFCQVVTVPFNKTNSNYKTIIKRQGKRTDGKLGSTGK